MNPHLLSLGRAGDRRGHGRARIGTRQRGGKDATQLLERTRCAADATVASALLGLGGGSLFLLRRGNRLLIEVIVGINQSLRSSLVLLWHEKG